MSTHSNETTTLQELLQRYGDVADNRHLPQDVLRSPVVLMYVPIDDIRRCIHCGATVRNQSALALDGAGMEVYDSIECLVADVATY